MASYTLTSTGTQTLTAGCVALHITVTVLPQAAGNGHANPSDYWGVGFIRPGNASAYWEPFPIVGGPQWMPLPYGTTRMGYTVASGGTITVDEVFSPAPLAFPLSTLPDVALSSPSSGQVLSYSGTKWVNAAVSGGSTSPTERARVTHSANNLITNNTQTAVTFDTLTYAAAGMYSSSSPTRLTAPVAGDYVISGQFQFGTNGNGVREWSLRVNTSNIIADILKPSSSGNSGDGTVITTLYRLAAGDFVQLFVYHTIGGTIGQGSTNPYLAMSRI